MEEQSEDVPDKKTRRRGAAAARARADAQRAVRARAKALADIADRWATTDERLGRAATRRERTIERARQRAARRYDEEVAAVEEERGDLIRRALNLEGATTKEIAAWLAISSRKVNSWRTKIEKTNEPGTASTT